MFKLVLGLLAVPMGYYMTRLIYEGVALRRGIRHSARFHRRSVLRFLLALALFGAVVLTYEFLFTDAVSGGTLRRVHDILIVCFSACFFPQAILALAGHFTGKQFPKTHAIGGVLSAVFFGGLCITGFISILRLS